MKTNVPVLFPLVTSASNRRFFLKSLIASATLSGLLRAGGASAATFKTVKPGPFPNGMDTWFGDVYYKKAQFTGSLQMGGWGDEYDILFRFDLSGMPQVATAAYLWLYPFPRGDASSMVPIRWSISGSQWQTGTLTWDTKPTLKHEYGQTPAPKVNQWNWYNIVWAYNKWRNGSDVLNFGLRMRPAETNNRFNMFHGSGSSEAWARPQLDIYYTQQADDLAIKLRWPLSIARSELQVSLAFGGKSPLKCLDGTLKTHNGTDYATSVASTMAGRAVYASEDGIVKEVVNDSARGWASNTVLEHNSPWGGKLTTVYWHINPFPDFIKVGNFIPKGMQIGTVANLGTNTHFHFGVRRGAYTARLSGTGALPYPASCDSYPAFPAGFIDPQANVVFQ